MLEAVLCQTVSCSVKHRKCFFTRCYLYVVSCDFICTYFVITLCTYYVIRNHAVLGVTRCFVSRDVLCNAVSDARGVIFTRCWVCHALLCVSRGVWI